MLIVGAEAFRETWLFPFLTFSRSGNVTGWVYRVQPPTQPWTFSPGSVPSFDLWQEGAFTPSQIDYFCIHCNALIQSVELNSEENVFVYRQTLVTPLAVRGAENYILGIQLPSPGPNNINLSFQYDEEGATDRLSYFFSSHSNFFTINEVTYRDNLHIPLVSPLYGKPLAACTIITLRS